VSCPAEPTLLRYADAELRGDDLHALEAHLVGCRACRSRVVALQSESLLLGDVLQERSRRAHVLVHAERAAPEPGVALGVPLAIAAVTAVTAVGGAVFESRLPGGLDLMNPLRLKGAIEMVFDLIFLLRDRAPGLLELGVAVAAMASLSALLSFGVGALYRRVFGTTALLLLLLVPRPGAGFELRHVHDGDVRIGASETVDGTLVVSSETVHLDGVVEGDLIVASERVHIAGTLRGNLYAFARRLEITGTVTGSIVALTEESDLDGAVAGSAWVASDRLGIGSTGRIGRDLAVATNEVVVSGRVARDVFVAGDRVEVRGEVGRDLTARWGAKRVTLLDAARIGGHVDAWLHDPADLERAAGAQVAGEVRTHERERARDQYLAAYRNPRVWALHALFFVAAFLFGLLVHALAPRLLDVRTATTRQLFSALGVGFAALIVTPIALVLLILTLIGIPVAILGLFAFLVALYLSEIVVAAAVGRWILPPRGAGTLAFGRTLLVGLALVLAVEHIPFIGVPAWLVAVLIGFGSLVMRAWWALFGERGVFQRA
jgi:cytoskeletal protein CcmA (bactofilin family)